MRIETGIPDAVKLIGSLKEQYKTAKHIDRQIAEYRIYLLDIVKEATERLEAMEIRFDGQCPVCARKFSEYEMKDFSYCPKCGQALISEYHKEENIVC